MRAKRCLLMALAAALLLGSGCGTTVPDVDVSTADPAVETLRPAKSTEGLAHEPTGRDQLYGAKEAPVIWWERTPRDPQEGEIVEIDAAVWRKDVEQTWLSWTLNGKEQEPVSCRKAAVLQDSGLSKQKYIGQLGPFQQGDRVEYRVCAGVDEESSAELGPFSFSVLKWEPVERIENVLTMGTVVVIEAATASMRPSLMLSVPRPGTLRLTVEPSGNAEERTGEMVHLREDEKTIFLGTGEMSAEFQRASCSFTLYDEAGAVVIQSMEDGLEILTDGMEVRGVRLNLQTPPEQGFYGFGMKYDSLNQRHKNVDTYCVNWYTDQMGETYTPVPYYFVPNTYGLFVDSTYYSRFDIDNRRKNVCTTEVSTQNDRVDIYLFTGDNAEIADAYTEVAGKPVLPPVWAFGPWISANEWNRQSEVLEQLALSKEYEIPTSVIVLEAWSDEETFYTWNDSRFAVEEGAAVPKLSDFNFGGRWPDPKEMIDTIHAADTRVLLWQIPVLKQSTDATEQSRLDQQYAREQGYVLSNGDGSDYRLPQNSWFGGSLLMDFTNPEATKWFLSKRRYLVEELGVDGFKTDGGEFVWGRAVNAFDGRKGDELRNAYPDLYAQAYFDYSRDLAPETVTFSRAGGAAMQNHPLCWVGDQKSTPRAFEEAIRATLSASMSGIPFVAWDIAGFSGDVPTAELYQRAVAQAAFSPVMQVHSEASGDPEPSQARTPWNMAERKGDNACLETYRYFANVRMNLLPYLYTQARHSSLTGEPLMRSMAYAFPGDKEAEEREFQYMLGESLLVTPVVEMGEKEIEVYLPGGMWYGLFDGKEYPSGHHTVPCSVGNLPVFVREGSILPLNLDGSGELGGYVGNAANAYKNLTFWAYPGCSDGIWYDYVGKRELRLSVNEVGEWDMEYGTPEARVVQKCAISFESGFDL